MAQPPLDSRQRSTASATVPDVAGDASLRQLTAIIARLVCDSCPSSLPDWSYLNRPGFDGGSGVWFTHAAVG
jgi:hypothetical protein